MGSHKVRASGNKIIMITRFMVFFFFVVSDAFEACHMPVMDHC